MRAAPVRKRQAVAARCLRVAVYGSQTIFFFFFFFSPMRLPCQVPAWETKTAFASGRRAGNPFPGRGFALGNSIGVKNSNRNRQSRPLFSAQLTCGAMLSQRSRPAGLWQKFLFAQTPLPQLFLRYPPPSIFYSLFTHFLPHVLFSLVFTTHLMVVLPCQVPQL